MEKKLIGLYVLAILLIPTGSALADINPSVTNDLYIPDSNHTQILSMKDGSIYYGRITRIDAEKIHFHTSSGDLKISHADTRKIVEVPTESVEYYKYDFENPNTTRLLFIPTGRMLERKTGHFANYYVFFPTVSYGFTEHFSMGAGVSLIPGIGVENQAITLMPKVGFIQKEKFAWAGGAMLATPPLWWGKGFPLAGLIYSTATFGSLDRSFTCGTAYGFYTEDGYFSILPLPMVILGGEARVGRNVSLVTENWIIPDGLTSLYSLYSGNGVRLFGKRISVDLGLIVPVSWALEGGWTPVAPYVDFVYNFKI